MNTLRCLIVDDEELARTLLSAYIQKIPGLEIVASCSNPLEAMTILAEKDVDVLFLDIQMPELTGVELLRTLAKKPVVVFTTAYPDYALEGYNLDVCDYLLKPFSFERFLQSVNKVRSRTATALSREIAPERPAERDYLLLKADHKVHRLRYDDILFIQSMREYAAFHTSSGRILSLISLKSLEEELPGNRFVRIHKSYIVAIEKVDALEGNQVIIGKEKLPVGESYREAVMSRVF
jgi:DNA-binding LytR/AlgR family response regulator